MDTLAEREGRPMMATFLDGDLEAQFTKQGYVVIDRFDQDQMAVLRAEFKELYRGEDADACHRSNESLDLGYRQALHELISGCLGPVVDQLLTDHLAYSSGALVKGQGPNSVMPTHQDWTVVEEPAYRSLSAWLPLCDTSAENGSLHVLPGSQQILDGMRPNPGIPRQSYDPAGDLDPRELTSIDLRAGECLLFDQGLLHGSPPNTTNEPRIALVLAAVPRAATMQHLWRRPEDDLIERFEVADPEFFRHCTPGLRPDHPTIRLIETVPFRPHSEGAVTWLKQQTARPPASGHTSESVARTGRKRPDEAKRPSWRIRKHQ